MRDLLRRMMCAEPDLAVELIRRGAFPERECRELGQELKAKSTANVATRRKKIDEKRGQVRAAIAGTVKSCDLRWPGFVPALAHCDRQLAVHAVINANLTDGELRQLDQITSLQRDGHLLRQLRVAIELEIDRRKNNARRGGGNRVATKRG